MTPALKFLPAAFFVLFASAASIANAETPFKCESCAEWNKTQTPFKLYGNSYYVGPHGLGSILITSDQGHVLIDGALPESASKIAANVRALGFRVEDIKVILNSHAHFDHAGGIAELQRLSGAKVWASPSSAKVLESGEPGADDPQFGTLPPIRKVSHVSVLKDGGVVRVGKLALTAHFTPGHTPGGTTWSWKSCEGERCLDIVYPDSLTAISAPDYRFSDNTKHPGALEQFEKSYSTLASLPCELLVTPHPEASGLWERLEKRESQGNREGLINPQACADYVAASRERLRKRLTEEGAK